jgi:hypothetical protein
MLLTTWINYKSLAQPITNALIQNGSYLNLNGKQYHLPNSGEITESRKRRFRYDPINLKIQQLR